MNQSDRLKDFLVGYLDSRTENQLGEFEKVNWQDLAKREQEKRAGRLIEVLDDELIDEIASGELSIPQVAGEIYTGR